ncbi:cell cycle protein MesJ [Aster yellows witches'-broom phytoplasma AYWB]|uniref:tRNA(Ile)-lysidine synthase n=2 Tax=16SrI (Aster yellows group) TaxID=3042590 RepID=TILS_AYWBP|nr:MULTISPECIES: tRNA lysidine(34) synthetase TilS [16SrI (Aster yellows group)]Q2NIN4.1 RecName: Full=tRNA(Ile)-lysidine synthase; AltName: Full=tRNA(Ile)-2-lysyl-cytidine synthase; AltName: Full=tRNA(Ile)-lysidine synthetase [Aster yellows witches'-broom phytoplasma AYWB]ABC65709.1 cell cycle protein MesJ [Aster yellows witches'-broom phytoplasma AYWB]PEH36143.1 tRNA(Ile)-lysidine synthetase [New Jersey aster yellows phytoplasma]
MENIKLACSLETNQTYIIAVSGGVDSMALLHYLVAQKIKLQVVHFNHLTNSNTWKNKELVKNYCLQNSLGFHYFELNCPQKNFQAQARLLRQQKLMQIAAKHRTPFILTAHHLDDLAETILQKISRSSTLLGYSGMQIQTSWTDFIFLKPFLYIPKAKIISYAAFYKIPFLEDYTNQKLTYQRNQIRHQVIPYLKTQTSFLQNIQKYQQTLLQAYNFIRKQTLLFLTKHTNHSCNQPNSIALAPFLNLDLVIQKDIILLLLEQKNITQSFIFIQNIIKGINNPYKPNLSWHLNSDWHLIKDYKHIKLMNPALPLPFALTKPLLCVSTCNLCLVCVCPLIETLNYNSQKVSFPLKVRLRQPKDTLKFSFGTKKLKKFLIEKKVPLTQRNNLWLVVDNLDNILFIPQLYTNLTLGNQFRIYLAFKNFFTSSNCFSQTN